jgi:nitroreductase
MGHNFLALVGKRQSDRAYSDKAVETEKLERVLEAARLAPSACNAQPWKMIMVTDPEKRMKIADACTSKALSMNHFSKQAPVQIVLVEEKANFTSRFGGMVKQIHYPHLDLGIVASHICLAAADEGLGTCMLGWLNEKKIKAILDIPGSKKVMLVILLGYSVQDTREKKRKKINEIVSREKY